MCTGPGMYRLHCTCIYHVYIFMTWKSVFTFIQYNICLSVWYDKWNESGFRPPLCTYRLNWVRRTSWGWWDDWDDTVLQTQDSKFEPWRSEAEHATSRSRRLPTILTFTRGWGVWYDNARNACYKRQLQMADQVSGKGHTDYYGHDPTTSMLG